MQKRPSPITLLLIFVVGLGAALVLQLAGVAVVPPDKTSTLMGVVTGAVVGVVILLVFRARSTGKS